MRKMSENFIKTLAIILLSSLLFDLNLAFQTKSATVRIEDGLYLRCLVWYDNEWNMEFCSTSSTTTTSNTATVNCYCRFVLVFSRGQEYFLTASLYCPPPLLSYTSGMDMKLDRVSQN